MGNAIIHIVEADGAVVGPYEVGTSPGMTSKTLAGLIRKLYGRNAHVWASSKPSARKHSLEVWRDNELLGHVTESEK